MIIKISIIVPVYNVQNYLRKCIDSLLHQTYQEIEIILVNDGSIDRSPKICDEYSKIDSRVKVIHKANGGLSDARNVGLKVATGEYVMFVDSDDYIETNTCKEFIYYIEKYNADIIVGNAKRVKDNDIELIKHRFITKDNEVHGTEYLKQELINGTMFMAVWLNLYKRNFLINNKFEFKVGLLHEDEQFTPRVFLKAKKVLGTNIIFYNYLIRENSITTKKNKIKNAKHLMNTCKELAVVYEDIKDNDLKLLLNDDLVNKYLNIFQVAGLHRKKYSYLIDKKFLLNKSYTKRNKLKVRLFNTSIILYYYINKVCKKLSIF